MEPLFNVGQTVWLKRDGKEAIVHGVAGLWLWLDMLDGRQPETALATDCVATEPERKFKVGDAVLVVGRIKKIDNGKRPYLVEFSVPGFAGDLRTALKNLWFDEDFLRADA